MGTFRSFRVCVLVGLVALLGLAACGPDEQTRNECDRLKNSQAIQAGDYSRCLSDPAFRKQADDKDTYRYAKFIYDGYSLHRMTLSRTGLDPVQYAVISDIRKMPGLLSDSWSGLIGKRYRIVGMLSSVYGEPDQNGADDGSLTHATIDVDGYVPASKDDIGLFEVGLYSLTGFQTHFLQDYCFAGRPICHGEFFLTVAKEPNKFGAEPQIEGINLDPVSFDQVLKAFTVE